MQPRRCSVRSWEPPEASSRSFQALIGFGSNPNQGLEAPGRCFGRFQQDLTEHRLGCIDGILHWACGRNISGRLPADPCPHIDLHLLPHHVFNVCPQATGAALIAAVAYIAKNLVKTETQRFVFVVPRSFMRPPLSTRRFGRLTPVGHPRWNEEGTLDHVHQLVNQSWKVVCL